MSNLTLDDNAAWHDDINQVDVDEPIIGGDGGNANLATRQLAENINLLKKGLGDGADDLAAHIAHANPHPQYVLLTDYNAAMAALTARIDDLESTAGVGTLAGVIEVRYVSINNSQNGTLSNSRTIVEETGKTFGYPPAISISSPISNSANSYDETITFTLPEDYTPEDYTVSATNNNGTYSINEESKTVVFTTTVSSTRSGEGVVTDKLDATLKVSMYVK